MNTYMKKLILCITNAFDYKFNIFANVVYLNVIKIIIVFSLNSILIYSLIQIDANLLLCINNMFLFDLLP